MSPDDFESILSKICSQDLASLPMAKLMDVITALNHALIGLRRHSPDSFGAIIEEASRAYPLTSTLLWMFDFVVDSSKDDVEAPAIKGLLGCCINLTYRFDSSFSKKAIDDPEFPKKVLKLLNYPESCRSALALVQNLMVDKGEWPSTFVTAGLFFSLAQGFTKTNYPEIMQWDFSLQVILKSLPSSESLSSTVGFCYSG